MVDDVGAAIGGSGAPGCARIPATLGSAGDVRSPGACPGRTSWPVVARDRATPPVDGPFIGHFPFTGHFLCKKAARLRLLGVDERMTSR